MFAELFINAFRLRYTPRRQVPSLAPFYRWGIYYTDLPKFTELVSGRPKISTQAFWLQGHTLSFRAIQSLLPWYPFCRALTRDGLDNIRLWSEYYQREQTLKYFCSLFSTKGYMNFSRVSWLLQHEELSTECLYLCFHKWKIWGVDRVAGLSKFT